MPEIGSLSVGIGADTAAFQTALAGVQQSLARVGVAVTGLGAPMAGLSGASGVAAGAATGLAGAESAAAGGATAMAGAMPGATAATGGMTVAVGGLRGAIGSLMTMMAPLLAAFSAIAAIKMGVGFQADIETATVQFEVLLGSADAAKARVKELYDFAAKTPFQFPEVLQASKILETFTKGALATGGGLTLVGDVAAGTGKSFEEVAMWIGRAYASMQAGEPFGEATMRLLEMGAIGPKTKKTLEDMSKSGASATAMWKLLTGEFDRYGGMMEKQGQTFSGLLSTVMDTLNQALGKLAGPLFDALKGAMPGVISTLGGIGPALDSLGAAVDNVGATWETNFGGIRDLVAGVVAFIMPYVEQVRTTFLSMWANISESAGPAMSNIMAWLGNIVGFIQSIVMPMLPPLWEAFKGTFDAIANAVNIAFILVRSIIETVLAVIGGDFDRVGKIWEGAFADIGNSIGNIVKGIMAAGGETIGTAMAAVGEGIGAALGRAGEAIGEAMGAVGEAVGRVMGFLGRVGEFVINALLLPFKAAFVVIIAALTLFRLAFGDTFNAIGRVVGDAMGTIGAVVGDAIGAIGSTVGGVLGAIGEQFGSVFSAIGSTVGDTMGPIGSTVGDVMGNVGRFFGDTLGNIGAKTGEVFGAIGLAIGDAMGSIGVKVGDALGGLGKAFATAWEGIKTTVLDTLAAIWQGMKDQFNNLIGLLNNFIGAMNDTVNAINATMAWTGISLPNIPTIPTLAAGGVAPGGLTLVGERGTELLNLPRGTTVTPLSGIVSSLGGGFGASNINLRGDVYLDGQKVGRVVWDDLKHRAGVGFALGLA